MTARILVVDDERRNVDLVRTLLRALDCEVDAAYGGHAGLEAFDAKPPDLVLLDVSMPDLDGIDVLSHIRARDDRGRVPVVLVTAHGERAVRLRGFAAGADEFLEKPIDKSLLLLRVRTLLDLRATQQELAAKNESLERLHREQRELTAFVVHDLRNPIAIAAMNIAYARGELAEGSSAAAPLADAEVAIARVGTMVNDLLTISRLEASEPLHRKRVALGAMLAEILALHRRAAAEREITVMPPRDHGQFCDGDPAILRRVFENIVENALRYTPRGGRIGVAVSGGEGEASELEIAVSNTGTPIPPPMRRRIFEKFVRLDAGDDPGGHVGLGLYYCHQAVAAHGGRIDVCDSDDWSTRFVVRLPSVPPVTGMSHA